MTFDAQRLYELLPAVYRLRDADRGGPLLALLGVIADQVAVVEENLAQLYDDQFIETCAPWVVPYIGDLIGYRAIHGVAPSGVGARAEVGHTIDFRRRKGTAAMLEQLARDVTGWDAHVVECFLLLATTQFMNHLRPNNVYSPDLRRWETLERLNTPFDTAAHTADVRSIDPGGGLYNIPNIGIFLWRLGAYSLTGSRAFRLDGGRWWFNPLGLDAPLYTHPRPRTGDVTRLAGPLDVPAPISRRVLNAQMSSYYGPEEAKSIFLRVDGQNVPVQQVECCDLLDASGGAWAHRPPAGRVAIDPVLGRNAFTAGESHADVDVTFWYGFSAAMGGGEYDRLATLDEKLQPVDVVHAPDSRLTALVGRRGGGVVQIDDSGRYTEALSLTVDAGAALELRAANNRRPTLLRGGDLPTAGDWPILAGNDAVVALSGLLVRGHTLRVPAGAAGPRLLRLVHCTLVPGAGPSLIVEAANVAAEIDHCIVGGLRVAASSTATVTSGAVDATADTAGAGRPARRRPGPFRPETDRLRALLLRPALRARAAPFHGQPRSDDVATRGFGCPAPAAGPPAADDAMRVLPRFTSLRYGDPGYCQLSPRCAPEITGGTDDEAEMGAFHDLFQPHRVTDLRVRLEEYLRFRLEASVLFVS